MACLFIRAHALRILVCPISTYVCQGICYRRQRTKPRSSCSAPAGAGAAAAAIIWPCMYSYGLPPVFPFFFMSKIILLFAHLAGPGLGNKNSRSGWAQPGPVPPVDDDGLHPILVVESGLFTGACSLYQGCERRRPATMSICLKRQTHPNAHKVLYRWLS